MSAKRVIVGLVLVVAVVAFIGYRNGGVGLALMAEHPAAPAAQTTQRVVVPVEVVAAESADLAETVELVGSLLPKFQADVRSEYPGRVAEVFVIEWVAVEEGQALVRLNTSDVEARVLKARADVESARAGLARAEAAARQARQDFDRMDRLRAEGVASAQDSDRTRAARDTAQADVAAAEARIKSDGKMLDQDELRLGKSVIRAPIAGVVSLRRVNVGDMAENYSMGDPLLRIVDISKLELVMCASSSDMPRIAAGASVTFATDTVPGREFAGSVSHVNPQADAGSRAVKVLAQVANDDGALRPGVFVKARIAAPKLMAVLRIPRLSLLDSRENPGEAAVFVLKSGGESVERRTVTMGREFGELVQITSGLAVGEQVVTRGAFLLKDGDTVRVVSPPVGPVTN